MKRNLHEAPAPHQPGRIGEDERRFSRSAAVARLSDAAPPRHSIPLPGTPPSPCLDGGEPRPARPEKQAARWEWIGLPALAVLAAARGCLRLAALRRRVQEAKASLEACLERRQELMTFFLATAPESAPPVRESLQRLRDARQQAAEARGIPNRAAAENEVTRWLARWQKAVETHPGFGAGPAGESVQEALRENANQLLNVARQYNERVMAFNVTIARFPWKRLARLRGDRPIEYFVLDEPARSGRGAPHEGG